MEFLSIQTIIAAISLLIVLGFGYLLYHYFSRPEPQLFPHFIQLIPADKIKLSKSVGTILLSYKNHYIKNNIEFDPTVLQLSLKNIGDMSLADLVVFITIHATPRKSLDHLNIDTSQLIFKKHIGKLKKNERAVIPLLAIGFFKHITVEFKVEGVRTDVRLMNRIKITDQKSFNLEDNTV